MAVLGAATANHLVERLLQPAGHRAGLAVADHRAVYFADRCHFHRRPREKQFVGIRHIGHRHRRHPRRNRQVAGQFQDRRTRDAHQDAGVPVVRDERAVFHDEQIFARAFRDLPLRVQQNRFVEAAALRLVDGSRRVDVLPARLRPRRHRAVVELPDRRHGDTHAVIGAAGVIRAGGEAGNRHGHGTLSGPYAQGGRIEKRDRPEVGRFQTIGPNQLERRLVQHVSGVRNFQIVEFRRRVESFEMGVEPEYRWAVRGRIRAHAFEHARAVVKTVREHGNPGLRPGNECAVEPDVIGRRESHGASIYQDARGLRGLEASGQPRAHEMQPRRREDTKAARRRK